MSQAQTLNHGEPVVGLIMGSDTDWATLLPAAQFLDELGIRCQAKVVSAHRTPHNLVAYATQAVQNGLPLVIAGAGRGGAFAGDDGGDDVCAGVGRAGGVGVESVARVGCVVFDHADAGGDGVATLGMGENSGRNAGLLAGAILANRYPAIRARLRKIFPERGSLAVAGAANVALVAGSDEDWETLKFAAQRLDELGVPYLKFLVATDASETVREAEKAGAAVFIVGTREPFLLSAQIANETILPVLSVPLVRGPVQDVEGFVAHIQAMPAGLATFAIGKAGAINAALFAAGILNPPGTPVFAGLERIRAEQIGRVAKMQDSIPGRFK